MGRHRRARRQRDLRTRTLRYEPLEDRRLLAVVTVDTPLDVVDLTDGKTSLREAIFATNLVGGADEIVFDFGHDGPETILLKHGELAITDSLTISGPGAGLLTINGHLSSGSIFTVGDGSESTLITVTLSGLTLAGSPDDVIETTDNLIVEHCIIRNASARGIRAVLNGTDTRPGGTVRVADSLITGNDQGGIFFGGRYATLSVERTTISNNRAFHQGGGIYASGLSNELVLDDVTIAHNSARHGGGLSVHDDNAGLVTIRNSTIVGNTSSGNGGGIFSFAKPLSLVNSTVSYNSALTGNGGGMFIYGEVTVTGSAVGNNRSRHGGGIWQYGFGTVTLESSNVSDNTAYGGIGGGIGSERGDVVVLDSAVTGNRSVTDSGGGIGMSDGHLVVSRSIIAQNHAHRYGGGIYSDATRVTLENTTISSNSANLSGGGISLNYDELSIRHSTITDNHAGLAGGGISALYGGNALVNHSIVAGNSAETNHEIAGLVNASYSLIGFGANFLGPLDDNGGPTKTHALLPGSPAINAGDPSFVGPPTSDQRGFPYQRISGGRIDIGAFESQPLPGDFDHDGDADAEDLAVWEIAYGTSQNMSGLDFLTWQAMQGVSVEATVVASPAATPSEPPLVAETLEAAPPIVVTTHLDVVDFADGLTSLREAIFAANTVPGAHVIEFSSSLAGQAILLTMGELEITDELVVHGLGSTQFTIDAAGSSRLFHVADTGGDVTFAGLTLTGGSEILGGGIFSESTGTLTFADCVLVDNHATGTNRRSDRNGGAVYTLGNVVLDHSRVSGNTSYGSGAGVFALGDASVLNSDVSDNEIIDDADVFDVPRPGGAGIYAGGDVTVEESEFHNNIGARFGGAIFAGGAATISESVIAENHSRRGGGGGVHANGFVTLVRSTLTENITAGAGGGFYALGGALVQQSTISDNHTTGVDPDSPIATLGPFHEGGGFAAHGNVTVEESTISSNSTTGYGGGIFHSAGELTIVSSTISGNTGVRGGGVAMIQSNLALEHSTVTGNHAQYGGGGLASFFSAQSKTYHLSHSIVAGNTSAQGLADLGLLGQQDFDNSLIGVFTADPFSNNPQELNTNLIGTPQNPIDPLLGPLADNGGPTLTHALLPGSPAINRGNPDIVDPPEADQRGYPFKRIAGGVIDIGALESQLPPGDFDRDQDVDHDDLALWEAGYGTTYSGLDFLAWQVTYQPAEEPLPLSPALVDLAMAVELRAATGEQSDRAEALVAEDDAAARAVRRPTVGPLPRERSTQEFLRVEFLRDGKCESEDVDDESLAVALEEVFAEV